MNNYQLLQHNFNAAANNYLYHAQIQALAAQPLLQQLTANYTHGLILDLGCGPGTLAHSPQLQLPTIGVDLSLTMLRNNHYDSKTCADAANLPFANNSIKYVISNLMLQWSLMPQQIMREIARCLDHTGQAWLTTLIQPSLHELARAWQQVDNHQHTLDFITAADYFGHCQQSKLNLKAWQCFQHTCYFTDLRQLLLHFKTTGTTLTKANAKHGLGGKAKLLQLEQAYEQQRTPAGLPLSYHFLVLEVEKVD